MNEKEALKLALEAFEAKGDAWIVLERKAKAAIQEALAQPEREWVGLTQEDIDIAFDDTQEGGGFDDFARAIEAKLKEKNHGIR